MPLVFLPVLFFADIIYLPPFLAILRHLLRQKRGEQDAPVVGRSVDSRAA